MHHKKITHAGKKLGEATKALIMIHGRGASAADILSLSSYLNVKDFHLVAPEATNSTWYPYSFMVPALENEPWLSSALSMLKDVLNDIERGDISKENIFILGFSQGACLALEFATRNASKFGGVIAFTGGLIGDTIDTSKYSGDFNGTPIFIGSSDPDMHVPVERVHESAKVLEQMNASVTKIIYPGMGHTINQDEFDIANRILSGKPA